MAESEPAGSRVTHELDPRRGRGTPSFGLPVEELDILAADDRAAEPGRGALSTAERLAVAARPVCAIKGDPAPALRAHGDGARWSFGGSGASPDQSFCETK